MISVRSVVRIYLGPPLGGIAQLGEHLLCKQGVSGSSPLTSTNAVAVNAVAVLAKFARKS